MNESFRIVPWLVAGILVMATLGCEPHCPGGYVKRGGTCYRVKDAGVDVDASTTDPGGEPSAADADTSSDGSAKTGDADASMSEPEGPSDACDPAPCEHGGRCSTEGQSFRCDCDGTGYEGPTCAADRNECAMLNACTSATYPCAQVTPPGYTCKGQFADWPMPDALAGAKHAPAYDTSTAGLVKDTVTELTWQRAIGPNAEGYTWLEAKFYCDQLELAGQNDWRLPSKIELESVIDETAHPANDSLAFGGLDTMVWSASSVVGEPDHSWLVDLLGGSSAYFVDVSTKLDVRCVRGPADDIWSGLAASRYTVDSANDTITDNRTSLVWERTLSTGNHTWEGAQQYCAALGQGWRLPAYKELLTLVDPTRINPSIDPLFPDTPAVSFWTASPSLRNDGTPDWPRRVDFATGASDFSSSTAPNRVRCVK